ncbi:MAG: excinuclease ABC subunit UvrC [Lachnospiraceae bacterium]|nr:excinuclease ABC subunit UvrC [Lachnospiraceae bacterium]
MFDFDEELKKLPTEPGVYLMHDEKDEIIYVGKAINLRNRVRQYFQSSRGKSPKIQKMVTLISRFEYIVTDSELEALVLECNLIKEHQPKYNTMLKDDKTYPYIKVTVAEDFPRVLFTRQMKRDKSKYFGPYTSAGSVKDTLDLIHRLYHIRTCNRSLPRDIGKERPCLNYHIKQCDAPCQGYISKEEYAKSIESVMSFLNGHYDTILSQLEEKMKDAAAKLDFETAGAYKELLFSVRDVAQKQKITDFEGDDRDVISYALKGTDAVVQVFFIRGGKLIGRDNFHVNVAEGDDGSVILSEFIKQFYAGTPYIPKEIFIPQEIEDGGLIEEWLSARRGQKVVIRVPKKGEKARLMELAQKNADMVLEKDAQKLKREEQRTTGAVKSLTEILGLENIIHRMEAYDISNISGYESVGSMVVYEDGSPKRSDYRKFKIKTVKGPNDYASMYEVLTRRFSHGLDELKAARENNADADFSSFTRFPDLIMMDGGKGQVNIAKEVLKELGLDIPVCGMVKDDNHRTRGLYFEDVELPIDTHGEVFKLITRVQDEAHRFAIEYHRKLRGKEQVHSVLDDIPGVGPARRKALMRHFKSIEAIKEASVDELVNVSEINRSVAEQIYGFFHA